MWRGLGETNQMLKLPPILDKDENGWTVFYHIAQMQKSYVLYVEVTFPSMSSRSGRLEATGNQECYAASAFPFTTYGQLERHVQERYKGVGMRDLFNRCRQLAIPR
jgi:hypothetical protein